jgi:hypothetical protein
VRPITKSVSAARVRFDPNWKTILERAALEVFEMMANARLELNPTSTGEPHGEETPRTHHSFDSADREAMAALNARPSRGWQPVWLRSEVPIRYGDLSDADYGLSDSALRIHPPSPGSRRVAQA